jgi:putative addiction module killer protein
MIEVHKTSAFLAWLRKVRDVRALARIQVRIDRLSLGNPGDVRPVGEGVSELRIDYGPGYRVYFLQRGETYILLLCGGDKSTQNNDIAKAKALAKEWSDGD